MHWKCIEVYLALQVIVFHVLKNCVGLGSRTNYENVSWNDDKERIKFMVTLTKLRIFPFDTGTYMTFCSGSLLADSKVITAAHCVYRKSTFIERFRRLKVSELKMVTKNMYVVAGDIDASTRFPASVSVKTEQWRKIKDAVAPHDYSFPRRDISLVFLKKPIRFHKSLSFIPYPLDYLEYNGMLCAATGSGSTLRHGMGARVMSNKECSKLHSQDMKSFVCAELTDKRLQVIKDSGGLIEKADEGGAIGCHYTGHKVHKHNFGDEEVIIGILVAVTPKGPIYTRLSAYTDFIEDNKASKMADPNLAVFYIYLSIVSCL